MTNPRERIVAALERLRNWEERNEFDRGYNDSVADAIDIVERELDGLDGENQQMQKPLRDQFAMAALTGILASDLKHGFSADNAAARAYDVADKMLKERGGE